MNNRKLLFHTFTFFFASFITCTISFSSNAQTIEKSIILLEGASMQQEIPYSDTINLTTSDEGIVSATAKDFFVTFYAKQPGTATVSFDAYEMEDHYNYFVTVRSKAEITTNAEAAYTEYLKSCKKGTKYAVVDFNHDGLNELYFEDRIIFYNYQTDRIGIKKHTFSKLYTCKKNNLMLVEPKKPRKTKEFIYYCAFYEFKTTKVFAFTKTGTGFRKYTPQGKITYRVNKDYAFYDTGYDQDDYDYRGYTKKQVNKKISKLMPSYKEVKRKKKAK